MYVSPLTKVYIFAAPCEIAFKEAWHKADFTPDAEAMYTEVCQIVKHMERYNFKTAMFRWCRDLRFIGVHVRIFGALYPHLLPSLSSGTCLRSFLLLKHVLQLDAYPREDILTP